MSPGASLFSPNSTALVVHADQPCRGERAASALEKGLTSIEQKINDLLEKAEKEESTLKEAVAVNGKIDGDKPHSSTRP